MNIRSLFLSVVATSFIAQPIQAHWFNVSDKISDKALKELGGIRNFADAHSISIEPMGNGKAIAIYHDTTGWFYKTSSYFSLFYDGNQWSSPYKIGDEKKDVFLAQQYLGTKFASNNAGEACFVFLNTQEKEKKICVCQFDKNQWLTPVTLNLKQSPAALDVQVDPLGSALMMPTDEHKIFYIKDQQCLTEELEEVVAKSSLVKDINGDLIYVAQVKTSTPLDLIKVCKWNGEKWEYEILSEIERPTGPNVFIEEVQGQLLIMWRSKGTEGSNIYSCYGQYNNWTAPELVLDHVSTMENMSKPFLNAVCSHLFPHSFMSIFITSQGKGTDYEIISKIWQNGAWEENKIVSAHTWKDALPHDLTLKGNTQGQACLLWKTYDSNDKKVTEKVSIWDGTLWATPHENYFYSLNYSSGIKFHDTTFDIDEQGNVLLAFTKEFSLVFKSFDTYYYSYSNGEWSDKNKLAGDKTVVPNVFNFKGKLILTWVDRDPPFLFSFFKNGELTQPYTKMSYAELEQGLFND